MARTTGSTDTETEVFLDDDGPVVDTTGTLAVLGHRAISALSSAGLSVAVVRAYAAQSGDLEALATCAQITDLIEHAARAARDQLVLRPGTNLRAASRSIHGVRAS
jgi:hypothetical protein